MSKNCHLAKILLLQVLIIGAPINSQQNLDANLLNLVDQVSGERLMNHVRNLTSFQTRFALSDECNMSALFLHNYFGSLNGFNATLHYFHVAPDGQSTRINVIASKNGEWKESEYIMLIAHYDSISDDPYVSAPGASDNACGVAVLMEVGSILSEISLARTLILITFSGEELGLAGSRAWVKENKRILEDIMGVICLDGVARGAGISIMFADDKSQILAEVTFNLSTELGYRNFRILPSELGVSGSDSGAFLRRGIRVIRLWDKDTTDIHTLLDTVETFNQERLVETTKTILATVNIMANNPLDEIFPERPVQQSNWHELRHIWIGAFFGVGGLCIVLFILIRKSIERRFL